MRSAAARAAAAAALEAGVKWRVEQHWANLEYIHTLSSQAPIRGQLALQAALLRCPFDSNAVLGEGVCFDKLTVTTALFVSFDCSKLGSNFFFA